ncbi:isochorismatase family protein [Stenotrophobium rhamnosiphilum]|uniref:Hydrolase n=1 Tax=Stenotrophobium rhamnosiphilum TaxID=2029166 RepID=A0A2T5MC87_9GAMM|nr:isochorismatase family protein [Stenotrophobium rhamnosiphilum]PTU30194.1 hydrolase [Stenotrophobium rhamnosiphilum]
MALTTLDAKTALIVIDLQNGVVAMPTVTPAAEIVQRCSDLASAFRRHRLPVMLVNVVAGVSGRTDQTRSTASRPDDWAQIVPELHQQPEDHVVSKRSWGAFSSTDLQAQLQAQGVTQVVICGIATSIGVESTARHAYELGFNVTLAVDAMTDTHADSHVNSITRIFPRLGECGSTQEIIELLDRTRA